jgi:hypothetical protein
MAAKIELQIVADNADYITKTKQVEDATKSMQTNAEESLKRQKQVIDQTTVAYNKAAKEKNKAFDTKGMDAHTKKTQETAAAIESVGGASGAAVGKVKSLSTAFKALLANPVALAITAIIGALTGLVKLIKSTDSGANALAARFEQLKALMDVIRQRVLTFGSAIANVFKGNWKQAGEDMKNTFSDIGDQMSRATKAAYDYTYAIDAIEDAESNYVSKSAEIRNQIAKLEYTAQDRSKATEERKKALQDALALGLEEVKAQKEFTRQKLDAEILFLAQKNKVTEQELLAFIKMTDAERENADQAVKDLYNRNEEKVNSIDQLYATWIDLDTKFYEENKRNLSRLTGFEEEINRDATEKRKKAEELRLENLKKFIDATAALRQEYEKTVVEGLEGTDRIRAEQEFELRQVQLLEDHLRELGDLTEEHYKYLDGLRASANLRAERAIRVEQQSEIDYWNDFYDEAISERMKFYDFREELDIKTAELAGELSGRKELEIEKKWLQARLDLIKDSKDPILQARAEIMEAEIALVEQKIQGMDAGESIWDKLGFNDEQREALQGAVNDTVDALDQIFEARVEDAQRTRELLDTQISETQRALAAEMELMKAGYASNVDAKRKELEELQKQREKALKQEEAAIKAKRQLETVTQTVSLISAAAETFKAFPGPLLPIAIATVAAMFAAFATAKLKASSAAKLAEGGAGTETGMITGRSHAQGGERFLDHVEVERGEMWGVLSKRATAKYGKQFGQIVTSFNKDQIPVAQMADVHNNINVDVNQTNERLDRVQGELVKLNRHFGVSAEVIETPTARIIKRGNKTRIIRK